MKLYFAIKTIGICLLFLFITLFTAASYTLSYSGLGFILSPLSWILGFGLFLSPLSWILGFGLFLSALTWTFGFVLPALSWTLTRLSKSPLSWFSWSSTIKFKNMKIKKCMPSNQNIKMLFDLKIYLARIMVRSTFNKISSAVTFSSNSGKLRPMLSYIPFLSNILGISPW